MRSIKIFYLASCNAPYYDFQIFDDFNLFHSLLQDLSSDQKRNNARLPTNYWYYGANKTTPLPSSSYFCTGEWRLCSVIDPSNRNQLKQKLLCVNCIQVLDVMRRRNGQIGYLSSGAANACRQKWKPVFRDRSEIDANERTMQFKFISVLLKCVREATLILFKCKLNASEVQFLCN